MDCFFSCKTISANLTNSLLNGRNKNTVDKLKKSCAFAICRSGVGLKVAVKSIRVSMNGKKRSVLRRLKVK